MKKKKAVTKKRTSRKKPVIKKMILKVTAKPEQPLLLKDRLKQLEQNNLKDNIENDINKDYADYMKLLHEKDVFQKSDNDDDNNEEFAVKVLEEEEYER